MTYEDNKYVREQLAKRYGHRVDDFSDEAMNLMVGQAIATLDGDVTQWIYEMHFTDELQRRWIWRQKS